MAPLNTAFPASHASSNTSYVTCAAQCSKLDTRQLRLVLTPVERAFCLLYKPEGVSNSTKKTEQDSHLHSHWICVCYFFFFFLWLISHSNYDHPQCWAQLLLFSAALALVQSTNYTCAKTDSSCWCLGTGRQEMVPPFTAAKTPWLWKDRQSSHTRWRGIRL